MGEKKTTALAAASTSRDLQDQPSVASATMNGDEPGKRKQAINLSGTGSVELSLKTNELKLLQQRLLEN